MSLWGSITGAVKSVGNAVGSAASTVGNVAKGVGEAAWNSPVGQVVIAGATGGLSVAGQVATGKGPVMDAAKEVAKDPWEAAKKLPGILVAGDPTVQIVKGVARGIGADSVANSIQNTEDVLKADPVNSLKIVGGAALIVGGVVTGGSVSTVGAGLVLDGARNIAGETWAVGAQQEQQNALTASAKAGVPNSSPTVAPAKSAASKYITATLAKPLNVNVQAAPMAAAQVKVAAPLPTLWQKFSHWLHEVLT